MNIKECKGYKKLLDAVIHDTDEGDGCFNSNGCNKKRHKCFHTYCDKFAWIIDRVNHYAEKTGLDPSDILDKWEEKRDYWYMNYYQDCKQPEIKPDNIKVFETIDDTIKALGKAGFRCPNCNGITKSPYECTSGIIVKDIKDGQDRACNWKAYGLFGSLGKGVHIFIKESFSGETIFMPIEWEAKEN